MTLAAILNQVDAGPTMNDAPIGLLRHAVRQGGAKRKLRIIRGGAKLSIHQN
jgi:hypothetical protein